MFLYIYLIPFQCKYCYLLFKYYHLSSSRRHSFSLVPSRQAGAHCQLKEPKIMDSIISLQMKNILLSKIHIDETEIITLA